MATKPSAVVLLSGGLDSATVLAIARAQGFALNALTVHYGQRHAVEVEAARRIAQRYGALRHVVLPKDRSPDEMGHGIPITYVPARNTIFLSLALGWAEALGATDIFIGVNALDYSGYPDCRPEFVDAFERLANLATRAGVEGAKFRVHTPLLALGKADIIRRGIELGLDYGLTHSCYDPLPGGAPCGACDSCILRANGFRDVGVADPVL